MKECVHQDHATDVCEIFGITVFDVDDKRDMRFFN